MPIVKPVRGIELNLPDGSDISTRIAPPYDVLDETSKAALLARDARNIVAVDLPHLPPKTVGPDATYEKAGDLYRRWQAEGTFRAAAAPAMYAYRQTFTAKGQTFRRLGLIADTALLPFGKSPDGRGGIFPHEQTFGAPKEDRLKLMRASRAQLSPVFGLYSDPQRQVSGLLAEAMAKPATFHARTANDDVLHEAWRITESEKLDALSQALRDKDVFIADGHHRYTTALNYRAEIEARSGKLPTDHPANFCLFVLVAMQEPGMIVLPTHRVLGGMAGFMFERFTSAAQAAGIRIEPFSGTDLAALERALPGKGPHAMGLYHAGSLHIATTTDADPLARDFPKRVAAWRQLDVAVVQHLLVERVCQPTFAAGKPEGITWKFPHTLADLKSITDGPDFQLGVIVQPTPLESVRQVSEAGELMPQKSTFFYPKLATGIVVHPLE